MAEAGHVGDLAKRLACIVASWADERRWAQALEITPPACIPVKANSRVLILVLQVLVGDFVSAWSRTRIKLLWVGLLERVAHIDEQLARIVDGLVAVSRVLVGYRWSTLLDDEPLPAPIVDHHLLGPHRTSYWLITKLAQWNLSNLVVELGVRLLGASVLVFQVRRRPVLDLDVLARARMRIHHDGSLWIGAMYSACSVMLSPGGARVSALWPR